MPIPTENVGSLPRPAKLQAALADYDAGKITKEQLKSEQNTACRDSIKRMEATGSPIVSDGEQRASSFATYPLTDTLAGTGLADNLAGDGQYFAIFSDGHHGGSLQRMRKRHPGLLCRGRLPCIDRLHRRAAACRNDPKNPWTGRGMLAHFVELNNRVIDRFSAEERTNIGIHTCPGGACDATHSADVDYAELLPSMFKMNAGYFLMQLSSEKDKERVYQLVGKHSREDAN